MRNTNIKHKVLISISGLFLLLSHFSFALADTSSDNKKFIGEISKNITVVGITFAIITIFVIGLRFALVKNSEEAAKTGEWLKYVIIACVILTLFTSILGLLINFEDKFYKAFELPKSTTPDKNPMTEAVEDTGQTSLFVMAIVSLLNAVTQLIEWVGQLADFKPLNQLLFNNPVFTPDQFKYMLGFYWLATLVATAFITIMVGKTSLQLISYGYSHHKKADLMQEIYTWFEVILLIAACPLIFVYMIKFFNTLTNLLYNYIIEEFSYLGDNEIAKAFGFSVDAGNQYFDVVFSSINISNQLNSAIVKAMYAYMYFKINMIFLVRQIVLGVFFLFTPLAAAMWGIKKDANVMNVWFGEMITNASMSFFYAFTLLAVLHLVNATGLTGWFFTLVAMWMIPQIGGVLRNLLQNYFQRMSGINEEHIATPFWAGVFPMIRGASTSFIHASSGATSKNSSGSSYGAYGEGSSTTDTEPSSPTGGGSSGGAAFTGNISTGGSRTTSSPFGGGAIPMGGFSGVPAASAPGADIGSPAGAGTPNVNTPAGFQNMYADTDFTRKAFVQNLNALTGSSRMYQMGNAIQRIGGTLASDNPAFGAFAHITGGVMKSVSGGSKMQRAIDMTTLQRMANKKEFKQDFANLEPVVNFLAQYDQTHLLTDAIKNADASKLSQFLQSKGYIMTDNTSDSVIRLAEAFKGERNITRQQLNINEIIAAKKLGHSTESFESYFAKRHPYSSASEAFIFKV